MLGAAMCAFAISGCSSGVVPMGRDTFMISGTQPGLIGAGTVRASLLKKADKWCRERNLVMVPLSSSGTDAVFGGQWANAELVFRAVPHGDRENIRPGVQGSTGIHTTYTRQPQPNALQGLAAGAAQFGQDMQQQAAVQQQQIHQRQLGLSQSAQRPNFPQTTTFRSDGFGGYRGSDGSTIKPDGFGGYRVTGGY